eukprot:363607-Chlamydomonas_euryale.AAC.11
MRSTPARCEQASALLRNCKFEMHLACDGRRFGRTACSTARMAARKASLVTLLLVALLLACGGAARGAAAATNVSAMAAQEVAKSLIDAFRCVTNLVTPGLSLHHDCALPGWFLQQGHKSDACIAKACFEAPTTGRSPMRSAP